MVKLYLQHCSRTVQPKYSDVFSTFYRGLFPESGSSLQCQLCTKAVSIKWGNSNFARTVWSFLLTACKYDFVFKEFATYYSNTNFEQCRVVTLLVVCRLSDHKCRHGVRFMRCDATHEKDSLSHSNQYMFPLDAANPASFVIGFISLCCCAGTWHHGMVRGVTFPSHA